MVYNRLLAAMTADDYRLLCPHLETVSLQKSDVLITPNEPISHVHFLEDGLASIVAISREGRRVEVGIVGREGMTAVPIVQSTDRTPHEVLIQAEGSGYRMTAGALQGAIRESATLHELLLRYAQALSIQTAYTVLSNAIHGIEERLAHWLLMCHDRLDGELPMTHDFLGIMLGVRRPSVTTALHILEGGGLIRASRGRITIRDRAALEEFTADGYGIPEAEYERLIGPMQKT